MEDSARANLLAAAFPAPPPFYKHFIPENIARFTTINEEVTASAPPKAEAGDGVDTDDANSSALRNRLKELPHELLYLLPPEPPAEGRYRSFGENFDISNPLPTLRSRGLEQLYPTPPPSSPTPSSPTNLHPPDSSPLQFDRTHELTKLTRSLLFSFLELVSILANDPSLGAEKIQDLRTLFLNCHHLINEYRPHQARETVIEMVADQIRKRRGEIEGVRKMQRRVEEVLAGLGKEDGLDKADGLDRKGEEMDREKDIREEARTRALWAALDEVIPPGCELIT